VFQRPRKKCFGDGIMAPLDRNAKCRLLVLAEALMKPTESGKHYGSITSKAFAVLKVLIWTFHNSKTGACFPSYEAIADAAGCARSYVAELIGQLEAAGLLTWCHRLKRIQVFNGVNGFHQKVVRTSNGYVLIDPVTRNISIPPSRIVKKRCETKQSVCPKTNLPSGTPAKDSYKDGAIREIWRQLSLGLLTEQEASEKDMRLRAV
jgi:hypothetical protein